MCVGMWVACDGVGGGGVLCCGVLLGGRGGRVGGWVLDGEGLVWVVGGGGESGLWKVGRVSIGDCGGEGGGGGGGGEGMGECAELVTDKMHTCE